MFSLGSDFHSAQPLVGPSLGITISVCMYVCGMSPQFAKQKQQQRNVTLIAKQKQQQHKVTLSNTKKVLEHSTSHMT